MEPPKDDLYDTMMHGLVTARLTRLLVDDEISAPLRSWVLRRFGPPSKSRISYATTCYWCASIYISAGVLGLSRLSPRVSRAVRLVLIGSLVSGVMSRMMDPPHITTTEPSQGVPPPLSLNL